RRGSPEGRTVSEARTELRREERRLAKWERAKAELEAIERQRLAEAAAQAEAQASAACVSSANGGGADSHGTSAGDLVAPPSSVVAEAAEPGSEESDLVDNTQDLGIVAPVLNGDSNHQQDVGDESLRQTRKPPNGPSEQLLLPSSLAELESSPNGF